MSITEIARRLFRRAATQRCSFRTRLMVDALEGRITPAYASWMPETGGLWTNAAAWSTGSVPGAVDDVWIGVMNGGTVVVPIGFDAFALHLSTFSPLAVDGTLTLGARSPLSGQLNVSGTVHVSGSASLPPVSPGDELSLLPYLEGGMPNFQAGGLILMGGGTVTGTIDTPAGLVTEIGPSWMGVAVNVAGAGKLDGEGWYAVKAPLTFNGDGALKNIYVNSSGTVDGASDMTVGNALISAGGTFRGPATSNVTVNAYSYVVATVQGQGSGKTVDGKGWVIAAGATEKIAADIELRGGAKIENNGQVTVTASSTIKNGLGGGSVDNKSKWNIAAMSSTVEVPFTSRDGGNLRIENDSEGLFYNFTQIGGTDNLLESGRLRVGQARIEKGEIAGGQLIADSQLDGSNKSSLDLSKQMPNVANEVVFTGTTVFTDNATAVTIRGDLELKRGNNKGATFNLMGSTEWIAGNIKIQGESKILNSGEFKIAGGGKVVGVAQASGATDGTFENSGMLVKVNASAESRFENIAFVNQKTGVVTSNEKFIPIPSATNHLVFSGGTGIQRGFIDSDSGQEIRFTDGTRHVAYTGSRFAGSGIYQIRDDAALLVASGNSTTIQNLQLTGSTAPGTLAGESTPLAPVSQVEIAGSFDWDWGDVATVGVAITKSGLIGTPAKMTVGPNPNPLAVRNLIGATLTVSGTAEVTADFAVTGGSRIIVDGASSTKAEPTGVFNISNASLTTDDANPGLSLWARNNSELYFGGELDGKNNPVGSIALPVVIDGSNLNSNHFRFLSGVLQRGNSLTSVAGKTVVKGRAPISEGPNFGQHSESIYIAGGILRVTGQDRRLESEKDIIIKPAATLDVYGTIQVGATSKGFVEVEGTFLIAGDGYGDAAIQGNLYLSGTTRINVKNNRSDTCLVTGAISLSGALDVVEEMNPPNQTWKVFTADSDREPPPAIPELLDILSGDFDSVSNGYSYQHDQRYLYVIKGAS